MWIQIIPRSREAIAICWNAVNACGSPPTPKYGPGGQMFHETVKPSLNVICIPKPIDCHREDDRLAQAAASRCTGNSENADELRFEPDSKDICSSPHRHDSPDRGRVAQPAVPVVDATDPALRLGCRSDSDRRTGAIQQHTS